jgi:DNA-binding LytR/AlgR family response regulator
VDVLFLDIQMPDLNGFALIKRLIHPPMIIFTTAYTDFAVKAFEVNAIDYLLKPFPLERFQKAVEKAKFYFEQVYLKQREESVFVKYDAQRHKIVQANILYIEGFDDYIKIYTHHAPRPILVLESLRKILPRLNPQYFVRLHRSYIVNTRHISSISKTNVVIEGKEIPIGETFKEDFLGKVGKK